MKKIILLFLFSVLSIMAFSQSLFSFRDRNSSKMGFKNIEGHVVIAADYQSVLDFSEGLAIVSQNDKWGFIDSAGKVVIPLKYNTGSSFSEGLASITVGENEKARLGYIDKEGKEVIPVKYDRAEDFKNGLAPVRLGEKWGYIDKTGKEVIAFKYDEAQPFYDEYAAVNVGGKLTEGRSRVDGGKWGFIDRSGKEVRPFQYDYALSFYNGLSAVKKDSSWFFIDKDWKQVSSSVYKEIFFHDEAVFLNGGGNAKGVFAVSTENKEMAYILVAKYWKLLMPLLSKYESIDALRKGYAVVVKSEKAGAIDSTGKEVIQTKYDYMSIERGFYDGSLVAVMLHGKAGYIDLSGKEIIPLRYDFVYPFYNGAAIVNIGGTADAIDASSWFSGGKFGLIDKNGKDITGMKYDYVDLFGFNDGLKAVNIGGKRGEYGDHEGGKWGYMDAKGKLVVPLKYDLTTWFSEGLAIVFSKTGKVGEQGREIMKCGYINNKGKMIIPQIYDDGEPFSNGRARVWIGDQSFLIDKKGNKVEEK